MHLGPPKLMDPEDKYLYGGCQFNNVPGPGLWPYIGCNTVIHNVIPNITSLQPGVSMCQPFDLTHTLIDRLFKLSKSEQKQDNKFPMLQEQSRGIFTSQYEMIILWCDMAGVELNIFRKLTEIDKKPCRKEKLCE